MLIAQISDLHVTEDGSPTASLVDSNSTLTMAINFLNRFLPRPDLVIATGDLTDRGHRRQYEVLRTLLDRCELPLYLIPGNHDERGPLLDAFPDHRYLRRDDRPLHYVVDDYPVRLIGVDTTRPGRHDGALEAPDLTWLDETLGARPDAPTLVFMHHPPFDTGVWWMDCVGLPEAHRRGFEAVIRRHPQVRRIVSGHVHRPVQTTWDATVLSVAPSTAHQVALDLVPGGSMRLTAEPPMITLLDWSNERILVHTTAFAPVDSVDVAAALPSPERAKQALLGRPPAPKGGAFG
jgi:3',5'-cyclic AMP phosphodiesterase CpdA